MENKIILLWIVSFLFLLVITPQIYAVEPIITVDLPNYFTTSMTPDSWYYKNVDLSEYYHMDLSSFEVSLTADYPAISEITVKVGNVLCRPNIWTTPNTTSLNYKATFDCTNYFSDGTINNNLVVIAYKVDNGASNMKPRIKLSYYQEPETNFNVLGTYYEVGDNAKVIAQLSQDGEAVNNATCFASIYHPDNTPHVRNTFMENIDNSDGLYVYEMIIPRTEEHLENPVGVWAVSVVCDYITNNIDYYPSSQNVVLGSVENEGSSIFYEDGNYTIITSDQTTSNDRVEMYINFTNITIDDASNLFVEWKGYTDNNNGEAHLYWWCYNDSRWEDSENVLESAFTEITFTRPLNESIENYVQNGTVQVKLNGSSPGEVYSGVYYFEDFDQSSDEVLPDNNNWRAFETWEGTPEIEFKVDNNVRIHGTRSLRIRGDGDNNYESGSIDLNLNTTGKSNITLKYWTKTTGAESNDYFSVGYTIDGSTWNTYDEWYGNRIAQETIWHLNSSFENNSNAIVDWYYNANRDNDKYVIDDIELSYTQRVKKHIYTDMLNLKKVQPTGVVNEIRGGGEFNVKDRLSGIEDSLNNITELLDPNINDEEREIHFMMPDVYGPNDVPMIAVYLTNKDNYNIGYNDADCTYTIFRYQDNITNPLISILEEQNLTLNANGKYYAVPQGNFINGNYQIEINCENGENTYGVKGFRMEENFDNKLDDISSYIINDLNVTLTTVNQNTQNMSDEIPLVMIGGTEYWSGEEGLVAVRLLKVKFNKQEIVTGATCTTDILYPNQTVFVNNTSMTEYGNGIYHYNFTAPNTTGVYIYSVDCLKSSKNYYAMNTFHVSPWANQLKNLQQRLDYIDSILGEINYTVNNLDFTGVNVSVNLTNVENDLQYLRKELDHTNEFTDEMVYLITDSIISVQKAKTSNDENEIKNNLNDASESLEKFKTLSAEKVSVLPLILTIFGIFIFIFLLNYFLKKRASKKKEEAKIVKRFKPQVVEVENK